MRLLAEQSYCYNGEHTLLNQVENKDKIPLTNQRGNICPQHSSGLQQSASVSNRPMCLGRSDDLKAICTENKYGYKCYLCISPCFLQDSKVAIAAIVAYLVDQYPWEDMAQLKLCNNCFKVCHLSFMTFHISTRIYPFLRYLQCYLTIFLTIWDQGYFFKQFCQILVYCYSLGGVIQLFIFMMTISFQYCQFNIIYQPFDVNLLYIVHELKV